LEAEQTALLDLLGYVPGLRHDYFAVAGALEYSWRQGIIEGPVKRIITIKRHLYGQATLPLKRLV